MTPELQAEKERLVIEVERARDALGNIESYTFSEVQFAHAEIHQAKRALKEFDERHGGGRMTRERFTEILNEYGFTDLQIMLLWNDQPDNLAESEFREAAVVYQGKGPKLSMRDGRIYHEIMPGILQHRRDLEDPDDINI